MPTWARVAGAGVLAGFLVLTTACGSVAGQASATGLTAESPASGLTDTMPGDPTVTAAGDPSATAASGSSDTAIAETPTDAPDDVSLATAAGASVMLSLEFEPGTAAITSSMVADRDPQADDPRGTHRISVLGADQQVLSAVRFTTVTSVPDCWEGGCDEPFDASATVLIPPLADAAAFIEIATVGVDVLALIPISPATPKVQIHTPDVGTDTVVIDWEVHDADGDELATSILYSPDNGDSWQPVAFDLPEQQLELPLDRLEASDTALFRAIVSDGIRSASAVSGSVVIPASAPWVEIASGPRTASGAQTVVIDATIAWNGYMLPGDDELRAHGVSAEWASDLDGHLGDGPQLYLTADTLSEGVHTITVTVTAPGAPEAQSSVELTVRR